MTTAIFHVDNEYKDQATSAGFDVNQSSDYEPDCFKVTIKNVDLNALKVFKDKFDWKDDDEIITSPDTYCCLLNKW